MLIRQKIRNDVLSILKPLEGVGIAVKKWTQGNPTAEDRVVVSTFNVSAFGSDQPKLGECCTIYQTIQISLSMSTPVSPTESKKSDEVPEDRLDWIEKQIWPYLGTIRDHLHKRNVELQILDADDVEGPDPETSKDVLTRTLSVTAAYKFSMNSPDKISV